MTCAATPLFGMEQIIEQALFFTQTLHGAAALAEKAGIAPDV